MNIVLGIVVGLIVLMFLIVSHEFGHFIMARRNGVRVKEFGVGFPPRLAAWVHVPPKKKGGKWTWKRLPKKDWGDEQKSLIFSVNSLPIGGFCAMDGESDSDERPGTFGSVSYWKKTKILFGGVAMNWLVAFLILTVLSWTGLPPMLENQFTIKSDETVELKEPVTIDKIYEDSPAEEAGFQSGDKISRIGTSIQTLETVYTSSDIINFNNAHAGETVYYAIYNSNYAKDTSTLPENWTSGEHICCAVFEYIVPVTLNSSDADYLLGVTMNSGSTRLRYTWSAPIVGAGLTVQMTTETYKGLWNMLVNLVTGAARQVNLDASVREEGREQMSEATEGVSGIVGILGGYFPNIVSAGPTYVFVLAAIISVSLACMNVLPIPALDGGRWFMITLARLKHKKLSQETEQRVVARAFIFLLILMAIITVMDIVRLF